ncbi:MAG: radical SAM protein [Spirochaetia bacterium]|nr:radical SAM protein [Spirochaetia bacterium]
MKRTEIQRKFETLRLSVTSSCNFSCFYCAPKQTNQLKSLPSLTADEYCSLVKKIHDINNLTTVRITGGEPLLFQDIEKIIGSLKNMGIKKVSLTTNGSRLGVKAEKLKHAGLDEMNISLDAVENENFKNISGYNTISPVLEGIQKTIEAGIPVKLNCTILKGYNEDQILPVLDYAVKNNIVVRFLEFMKMGILYSRHTDYFYPEVEILRTIAEKYRFSPIERKISSTARYWRLENGLKFGIIANHSTPFCHDCNRLRMDSTGKIYGCLSNNQGFNIIDEIDIQSILNSALYQKQKINFTGSSLIMKSIGG